MFLLGAISIITIFTVIGAYFSKTVTTPSDYSMAGRSASASGVSGIILGALVGGASTVGTVQMAYQYGLSAWWFTLGAGLGCLFLGLWFAKPLRNSNLVTIPEFIKDQYGYSTSILSMLTSLTGTLLSVIAQFLAGVALLKAIFPIITAQAVILTAFLVMAFIFLGGLKSYSQLGKAKIVLLYLTLLLCSSFVLMSGATPFSLYRTMSFHPYFHLFGRGYIEDAGACISMIVGVFCTQIYIQGIFAASSASTARKGVLLAAAMTPPLGLMGVFIGLYLRSTVSLLEPSQALAFFIFESFPPLIAGILWGGILITVIGTAAGLSLGIATNVIRDIIFHFADQRLEENSGTVLILSRITVALMVIIAAVACTYLDGTLILQWSFLSMGLRGVGTFFPLVFAILFPGHLSANWAFASIAGGFLGLLWTPSIGLHISPLITGISVSGLIVLLGCMVNQRAFLK
ncbi:MAG: sodium:solute symporter family protein [Synergistales bacterium]|nr:sodium:solute symporter family protein [Synergistales bacterium]